MDVCFSIIYYDFADQIYRLPFLFWEMWFLDFLCIYHLQTTMNLFWIAGIISIAVLIYFMDSADFGINILNGTYEQVLYWLRGERYMEKVRWMEHTFIWIGQSLFINFVCEQDNQLRKLCNRALVT